MKKTLQSGYKSSVVFAIAFGIITSFIISLIISLIGSTFIARGVLGESRYGILCVMCWIISAVAGSITSITMSKSQNISICIITVVGYVLLLIGSNILLFEGIFHSLWKALLFSLMGMVAAFYIVLGKRRNKKKKFSYRTK